MSEMKRLLLLMEDSEKESGRKDRDDIGDKKDKKDKEDLTRASIKGTAQDQEVLSYVRQHYPDAPNTQAAFTRFVIRSLMHSYEDSERQEKKIKELERKIDDLMKMVNPDEEIFGSDIEDLADLEQDDLEPESQDSDELKPQKGA